MHLKHRWDYWKRFHHLLEFGLSSLGVQLLLSVDNQTQCQYDSSWRDVAPCKEHAPVEKEKISIFKRYQQYNQNIWNRSIKTKLMDIITLHTHVQYVKRIPPPPHQKNIISKHLHFTYTCTCRCTHKKWEILQGPGYGAPPISVRLFPQALQRT